MVTTGSADIPHGGPGNTVVRENRGAIIKDDSSKGDHLSHQPAERVIEHKGRFNIFKFLFKGKGREITTQTIKDVTPVMIREEEKSSSTEEKNLQSEIKELRSKVASMDDGSDKMREKQRLSHLLDRAVPVDVPREYRGLGKESGVGDLIANIQLVLYDKALQEGDDSFPLTDIRIVMNGKPKDEKGQTTYQLSVLDHYRPQVLKYTPAEDTTAEEVEINRIKRGAKSDDKGIRDFYTTTKAYDLLSRLETDRESKSIYTITSNIPNTTDGRHVAQYKQPYPSVIKMSNKPAFLEFDSAQMSRLLMKREVIQVTEFKAGGPQALPIPEGVVSYKAPHGNQLAGK